MGFLWPLFLFKNFFTVGKPPFRYAKKPRKLSNIFKVNWQHLPYQNNFSINNFEFLQKYKC
jgi:hypothetical protein